MPNLASRSREPELMDDPSVEAEEVRTALDELESINRTLGGWRTSIRGIARLIPRDARHVTVLDVGTGCGDLPRRLVAWGARRGLDIRVKGIDISEETIRHARARSSGAEGIELEVGDVLALDPAARFDIVHAALVLHHVDDEAAPDCLRSLFRAARLGLVINDLHRHRVAHVSIGILTRLLSRSRLVRNDGPLSVLRAFRREEILRLCRLAGLPIPTIRWRWAFRWEVVVRR